MATHSITTRSILTPPAAVPRDLIWRLSVEQYHEMMQAGILTEDDPVELLEGWLVFKMTKNPAHTVATQLIQETLEQALPSGWLVRVQEPITLEDSEPEPDVSIVRGQIRDYTERHPRAEEVALVVEVTDATLPRDREIKKHIYARAGIPVYWICNLIQRQFEVYSGPISTSDQSDYGRLEVFGMNDALPMLIDGVEVAKIEVLELLPW